MDFEAYIAHDDSIHLYNENEDASRDETIVINPDGTFQRYKYDGKNDKQNITPIDNLYTFLKHLIQSRKGLE